MTIFEHALIGGAVVLKNNPDLYWWAAISGIMPDAAAFLYATYMVGFKEATDHFIWKGSGKKDLPDSVFSFYYYSQLD